MRFQILILGFKGLKVVGSTTLHLVIMPLFIEP